MGSEVQDAGNVKFRVWGAGYDPCAHLIGKPQSFGTPTRHKSKEAAEQYAASQVNAKAWASAYIYEIEISIADMWICATTVPAGTLISSEPLSDRARHAAVRRQKEEQIRNLQSQLNTLENEVAKLA